MSRRQPLIVGAVLGVIAAIAVGVLLSNGTKTYQSTALLSIDEPRALAASDDAGVIDKLSRLRGKYIGLVGTARISEPLAQSLGVKASDLREHISASATAQDLLIHVFATSSRREDVARTTDALAAELVAYVASEQLADAIPSDQQVQLAIVQAADRPTRIAPTNGRIVGGAVLGGLVVGGLFTFLAGLRRRGGQPPPHED